MRLAPQKLHPFGVNIQLSDLTQAGLPKPPFRAVLQPRFPAKLIMGSRCFFRAAIGARATRSSKARGQAVQNTRLTNINPTAQIPAESALAQ
ncbi:Uncharacterised protein [Serratia quinivorans]|nr:Uncharacterised protein [Serratia quinivorans]